MTPCWENNILLRSSMQNPPLVIKLTQLPSRALNIASCVASRTAEQGQWTLVRTALGTKVPEHPQDRLLQALIVCLLKTHFLKAPKNCVGLAPFAPPFGNPSLICTLELTEINC